MASDPLRTPLCDRIWIDVPILLADYKLPRRLKVRSEPLPRSGMGKVDKRALLASLDLDG